MRTWLGIRSLPIKTIIDVGANTGQFARQMADIFPAAQLICFEPLPSPYEELCAWTRTAKVRTPIVKNIAIGDHSGEETINFHTEHSPSSSILNGTETLGTSFPATRKKTSLVITIETLDDAIDGLGRDLEKDIFIKLDVQGYEDRVLRGGMDVIRQSRAMLVEVNVEPLYKGQASFNDILATLGECGFHYAGNLEQNYSEKGFVSYFDAVFLKSDRQAE
jgi:FkbM family methyltransferase